MAAATARKRPIVIRGAQAAFLLGSQIGRLSHLGVGQIPEHSGSPQGLKKPL